MKIALVVEGVFPEKKGGLERWYSQIGTKLCADDFDVTYFNSSSVDGLRGGIHYVSLLNDEWGYLPGGIRSIKDSVNFSLLLFFKLWKSDVEVIYCSSVPIVSVFSAWIVTKIRKKILIVEWFEYWSLDYWIGYAGILVGFLGCAAQYLAAQCGDSLITFNHGTTATLEKTVRKRRRKKIRMMPGQCGNTLDLDFPEALNTKKDFMFLGRFVDEKQPELAIRAAVMLREMGWLGNLNIYGTGPNFHSLTILIEELKAVDFIKIHQNKSDHVIRDAMLDSFVLFHPTKREGYGYAQVEAAFRGLPTILIRYPHNASTELEINPQLYLDSDNLGDIVDSLWDAYENQNEYKKATMEWALKASTKKSSQLSIQELEEHMLVLQSLKSTR